MGAVFIDASWPLSDFDLITIRRWRSLMLPSCDEVLANASGTPHDPPYSHRPSYDRRDLLRLAQAKLVSHPNRDLERERGAFSRAAQVAVLDVRIMLPFEPRSSSAQRLQMELVASHMRTVFSIPQHRQCVRSGYPSEPILAEAAARQLDLWRNARPRDESGSCRRERERELEPAAVILDESIDDGLLDQERGEVGKAVGRMLLILARDRAALAAHGLEKEGEPPLFSRAVPVNAFIEALFSPAVARVVLNSKPDNLPSASPEVTTFAEAFKDAVVNFTHFARWDADDDDGSMPDVNAAVGCFVRSMALACRRNTLKVGAFIPVLLDQSAHLRPEVMTAILVRFNRKQGKTHTMGAGARAACPIDEEDVGLFGSDADGQGAPPQRPYITLVMELGVSDLPSSSSHTDTGSADVNSSEVRVPVDVGKPPIWVSDEDGGLVETVQHPRYSITAYGCSHSVYGVIGEHDSGLYEQMIRKGDPLREHPQQDTGSLDLVRMLKPAFSTEDASWDWMAKDDRDLGVQ